MNSFIFSEPSPNSLKLRVYFHCVEKNGQVFVEGKVWENSLEEEHLRGLFWMKFCGRVQYWTSPYASLHFSASIWVFSFLDFIWFSYYIPSILFRFGIFQLFWSIFCINENIFQFSFRKKLAGAAWRERVGAGKSSPKPPRIQSRCQHINFSL